MGVLDERSLASYWEWRRSHFEMKNAGKRGNKDKNETKIKNIGEQAENNWVRSVEDLIYYQQKKSISPCTPNYSNSKESERSFSRRA